MRCNCTLLKSLLVVLIIACIGNFASAQNCTVNAGIPQQYCNVTSFGLTGNQGGDISPTPNLQWTQVGGSPALTINSPNSLTTSVTNVVPGVFVFRLSITCEDGVTNFNDVTITVLPPPTIALAGSDQQVCNAGAINLSGNAPAGSETGTWSVISGGGSITNSNSPNAVFNAPGNGVFELEWEIDNGSCASRDNVIITITGGSQPVSAGADKTISCSGSATTLEGSDPGLSPQSGLWAFVSGPSIANIQTPTSPGTGVNGLIPGVYTFRWTVSGSCFSGSDEVTITVTDITASPSTGGNKTQTFCEEDNVTQVVLNAAPLAAGETGLWTQAAGPAATIVSNTTPTTQVNVDGSSQYTFTWTVLNSGGCSAVATHRLVFVPDFSSMTTPPDQILGCKIDNTTINIQYDYGGITTGSGLTRSGRLLTSPLTDDSGVDIERSGNIGSDTWTITGLDSAGLYTFLFEYRNACSAAFRTVGILVSDTGATSNAGSDIVLPCNTFTTGLAAAAPPDGQGIGEWSKVSGPPAVIQTPNSATTGIVLTISGVYVFRWSISNGPGCVSQTDEVTVTAAAIAIDTINAGPDTSFCAGISYTMQALTPEPTIIGTWSNFPGNVIVSDIHDPNAVISNLTTGQTVDFVWTLENACTSIDDTVTISATEDFAIQADAGPDQCLSSGTTTVQLNGNDPGSGVPSWTSLDGPNLNGTQQQNPIATIPADGTYRFVYNILSPGCGTNSDTVVITVSAAASTANAGTDQGICAPSVPASATLNATPPTTGTGVWTQTSGSAGPVIVNPDQPSTQINNLGEGIYDFAHTITNGACPGNADTVRIVVSESPGPVDAGPDQDLCDITTGTNVPLNATPATGLGLWTVQSGPGGSAPVFSDNTSATSTVRNLQNGTYVLRWSTVTGAGCPVFFDEITLNVTARANANTTASGACDVTTVTLIGNLNTDGTWTQVSKPVAAPDATIANDNPNTFSAIASGLVTGVYVFRYSLPAVGGCAATEDDVTVTIFESPTPANAGPEIELCPGVTSTTITGNTPTIGTVLWTRVSGPNTPTESGNNTPTLDLSDMVPGVYVYTYTISNGNCPASSDNVGVVVANAAAAGPDQQLCAATTATLAGNVPVVYTGTWTQILPGPSTANFLDAANPNTSVDNLTTGTYTFRWTINTPGTCPANFDEVTVIIDPALDITGVAGPDQTVCEGGGNLIIGTNTGPNDATYSWQPATLLTDATSQQTTFTGTGAGTYNYTLQATRGSCQSSDPVTITINQVPVQPVLNAPTNICENATTTVSVVSVQAGVTYNWTGDFVGTGSSQVVGPGDYTVTPVFDIGSCPGIPASITIIGDQVPTTADAGTDQDLCQDISSATLTGNIAVVGQPLWTQVNGPNTATITPAPASRVIDIGGLIPGVYTFEYSISNGTCPPSTDQVIVRKEITANAGSDQRLCNSTSANLTANTPFVYPGQWTQISKPAAAPDAIIVSPTNPSTAINGLTFGVSLSGTYVFRWTIESGAVCPANSDDITIIIDAPVVGTDAGPNITRCQGDPAVINLGAGVVVPGYTYTWTPSLDLLDPNAAQTEFTGVDPGRYDFTLTVSNNSCSASDDVSVIINALPETPVISVPAAACANGTATVIITNPTPGADYTWRQGTDVVANGDSVELGPGSYTVTPTSVEGCAASPVPLVLGSNSPPVASFTTTQVNCRFEYTATDAGPGSSYTFYFGADARPSLVTGIGPHLISYYPAGVKKTYLLTIDANGCRDTISEDVVVPCFSFPLPLNLVSFNGDWTNQYPKLAWEADNSSNMSHFEVERSTDGINFNAVRSVPISNVSILVRYNYTDSSVSPLENIYYYRLKIVENTGAITYSHIVRLQTTLRLIVEVNPNPFIDKLSIAVNTERTTKGMLSLLSVNGSTVKTQQISLQQGTNRIEMQNLSGLPGGRYFLRVQIGDEIKTYKLLKL